ncbi:hypothetical protein EJ08DRAFT_528526 [Tothia fuscella]|uniref:Uncharacterized protein n=1 Tax=Tothia fuscella TaxID=1048955 RepID=A0A9P4TTX1_9PEZI|nr:hypothetical protein EJ08DRAFT_528526 [Tothia fuscella]
MAAPPRSDSISGASITPTMTTKTLPGLSLTAQSSSSARPKSGAPTAPRIDYEPLYTALKAGIGENWHLYGESIALYTRGQLNQSELERRINPFLLPYPHLTHTHNQFLLAIRQNSLRDSPEPGVAAFVSANDKPTATSKPVTGDRQEQRLKTEVMHLPARERHRIKGLEEEKIDAFQAAMKEFYDVRSIGGPDLAVQGGGGGVGGKTNWELEISRRFAQPLFSESNEFPDAETLHKRIVPICYQEGLTGGCGTACSDLMTVAAETFIKEQLSDLFRRVRSNGPQYIKSASYRKTLIKEEEACERGEIRRNAYGLLPLEVEAERKRRPFNREDLRLAALMGNSYLAQSRILNEKVVNAPFVEEEYDDDEEIGKGEAVNGFHANGDYHDEGMEDAVEWGWMGGAKLERDELSSVLDDVLGGAF